MAFQSWLKQLRDRGIVLAVCSKNNEATAREPFLNHPDMLLRLDDIAVFVANWEDKATNIRRIKNIVDIDFSAMMFLDDNPVERQLVRESFPTMIVPDLPEDPSEYVTCLIEQNLWRPAAIRRKTPAVPVNTRPRQGGTRSGRRLWIWRIFCGAWKCGR